MNRHAQMTVLCAATFALAGCNQSPAETAAPEDAAAVAPAEPGVGMGEGALRISTNPDAPSAAYVTLSGAGRAMTLTGVTSPDAERVELHESRSEGGMATMVAIREIAVPADGTVVMRPGGLHLMLFGLTEAARAAGQVTLVLQYADGTQVSTVATTANLAALQSAGQQAGGSESHGEHAGH